MHLKVSFYPVKEANVLLNSKEPNAIYLRLLIVLGKLTKIMRN